MKICIFDQKAVIKHECCLVFFFFAEPCNPMQTAGILSFGNVGGLATLTNNQTYKTVVRKTCFVGTTH